MKIQFNGHKVIFTDNPLGSDPAGGASQYVELAAASSGPSSVVTDAAGSHLAARGY